MSDELRHALEAVERLLGIHGAAQADRNDSLPAIRTLNLRTAIAKYLLQEEA